MNITYPFYDDLKDLIINNILNLDHQKIDNMYEAWYADIDNTDRKKNTVLNENEIHENQNVPNDVILKGIDLPTWFGEYSNRKIVVLGIDPLRNKANFKTDGANINSDVIIGTPYAFHEKSTREGSCASYWTLVDGLVKSNNFVYCTDIFKTFFYNDKLKKRSYNDSNFSNNKNNNHRQLLIQELDLIKPDIIIVFGKIAHSLLLGKNCPTISQDILKTKSQLKLKDKLTDVYTVLHLSKTPRGRNFKSFFEANNLDVSSINFENRKECAEKYLEIFKDLKII
jgi:hypothetical protein